MRAGASSLPWPPLRAQPCQNRISNCTYIAPSRYNKSPSVNPHNCSRTHRLMTAVKRWKQAMSASSVVRRGANQTSDYPVCLERFKFVHDSRPGLGAARRLHALNSTGGSRPQLESRSGPEYHPIADLPPQGRQSSRPLQGCCQDLAVDIQARKARRAVMDVRATWRDSTGRVMRASKY